MYNKWHETELERWLSDHNVPYPTPADRKDLENLVKENWQSKVASPYNDWDSAQMTSFLKTKGVETKDAAESNKEGLLAQVKNYWYEAEDKAEDAWSSVKDWIFDRYGSIIGVAVVLLLTKIQLDRYLILPGLVEYITDIMLDSQLKTFADKHDIPVPQPRKRDTLLQSIRSNYETVARKVGETVSYPGNWLYESWSESGKPTSYA